MLATTPCQSDSTARAFLAKCSFSTDASGPGITFAQFRGTPNEDRFSISEEWELGGHIWQFIAVFDGHGGSTTADYLERYFPSYIRTSMERTFSSSNQGFEDSCFSVSRSTMISQPNTDTNTTGDSSATTRNVFTEKSVSEFLTRQVRAFDNELGNAVKAILQNLDSKELADDKRVSGLYEANKEVIARARCGSTMAAVLVDKSENRMWVCSVGDSSVVFSTKIPSSNKRKSVLLNRHHTGQDPREYHRVSMDHPSQERETIWLNDGERIFGTLSMTRAFGDYMYKLHRSYTTALFSKVPSTAMKSVENVLKYSRTPPYVIADPFVTFVDLGTFEPDEDPAVLIYSDGLETLAYTLSVALNKRPLHTHEDEHRDALTPVDVIGTLLGQPLDPLSAFPSSGCLITSREIENNESFALMYNLLNRTIPMKLSAHLIADESGEDMYIDDVTVVVYRLFPRS
ncbi:phosphatase 2C-like domain-containing protein [Rhodocollybia butyracea]|uniref:Phosphatase 2C-like domain-containing protein n=1 Tax=Rhodocollybia butyracea TaxID=206335 RepID=A0A9P5U9Y9_9AGAR|nr:phosphatase 2C-like domain-containing protein [Rhodocollybia butyracea]